MRSEDQDRKTFVLTALVRLWDGLLAGKAEAELLTAEQKEVVGSAVGLHITKPDGTISALPHLRAQLRWWLAPARRDPSPLTSDEYAAVLVAHGLYADLGRLASWRRVERPDRNLAQVIAAATGWGEDAPRRLKLEYVYLSSIEPVGSTEARINLIVAELTGAGADWGQPRISTLLTELRTRLPAGVRAFFADDAITQRTVRLALMMTVGSALGRYLHVCVATQSRSARHLTVLAEQILPRWNTPADLDVLLQASTQIPRGVVAPDREVMQSVFRAFAAVSATPDQGVPLTDSQDHKVTIRQYHRSRLAALLELSIADARDSPRFVSTDSVPAELLEAERQRFGPERIIDWVRELLLRSVDVANRSLHTAALFELLEDLQRPHGQSGGSISRNPTGQAHILTVFERLTEGGRVGPSQVTRMDQSEDWVLEGLIRNAERYLDESNYRWDTGRVLDLFADHLPGGVAALIPANAGMLDIEVDHKEARLILLTAASRALTQDPTAAGRLQIASSIADLAWIAADEQPNDQINRLLRPLEGALRAAARGDGVRELAGANMRLGRVRPVADSKAFDFRRAAEKAVETVEYGRRMVGALMQTNNHFASTSNGLLAALIGLELALLQAGGVYVRSAENLIIHPHNGLDADQRKSVEAHIIDLAGGSFGFTSSAVACLQDIKDVERAGLVASSEVDIPATAYASTAAMGMRTLLLYATVQGALRRRRRGALEWVLSVPAQFGTMLTLPTLLSDLNYADLTRIALHYAFLTGDLEHPGRHADTREIADNCPPHLWPGGRLNLSACGQYLIDKEYDAGILDSIQISKVKRFLDKQCDDRFSEWLGNYHNPRRRTHKTFDPSAVLNVARTMRDPMMTIDR